jgi:hypothetical protein
VLFPVLTLLASPAAAQFGRVPRVRSSSSYLRLVLDSGTRRSPTFRAIVERLEESDLIVEVECGRFSGSTLVGRTVLLSAQREFRYALVEVSCPATSGPTLAVLGHELRHALEIASARWVVDDETLALLYAQIGYPNRGPQTATPDQFETADALDAGERVHHELFHRAELTRNMPQAVTK